MNTTLQLKDQIITAEEIIPLLDNYQMLPQFLREVIIDRSIEHIKYTAAEFTAACQKFSRHYQIDSDKKLQAWLSSRSMNQAQLDAQVIRRLKIDKFQREQWEHQLESYFLDRKLAFERAVFSLIRVKEKGIAQELYYRLQEQEQSFAEIAQAYSIGEEARNNGLVGAVKLIDLHHTLAQILHRSQPGQLISPKQIEADWVIVRLEKYFPAKLDQAMRQKLLNELFDRWLRKQLFTVNSSNLVLDKEKTEIKLTL